jgi:hypothetical protein
MNARVWRCAPRWDASLGAASLLLMLAAPAGAQDFDLPAPAWPPGPAAVWFERALPAAARALVLEAGVTRWHGVEGLATRSIAAGAGWRALRAGLGLSQTGEPDRKSVV